MYGASVYGGAVPVVGVCPGAIRHRRACMSVDYYGWHGFHAGWAPYMGWMGMANYGIWYDWQMVIGGMPTIGVVEQRALLISMLKKEHKTTSKSELEKLADKVLESNKQIGANESGQVKEITNIITNDTTTTTTTSTVTDGERYETANRFLAMLASGNNNGMDLAQASKMAEEIRSGKMDGFVKSSLETLQAYPDPTKFLRLGNLSRRKHRQRSRNRRLPRPTR